MRLRGIVFERFATFERAEVNLCDSDGAPLDVALFVGESGAGKTALLRGVSGLLSESVGAGEELDAADVRRGAETGRCRVVFDDLVESERVIVTLEKELSASASFSSSPLRATRPDVLDRWRRAVADDDAPRAAFSIASGFDEEGGEGDPLVAWLSGLRGTPRWDVAAAALDRVLWPYRLDHVLPGGEASFARGAESVAASELGDAFGSVMVMALELLRLSIDRPDDELTYVIDDIDAHLHPRWQTHLIADLRRAFPRVQLVATTHSPLVVASVEPHQVFRIASAKSEAGARITRVADEIPPGKGTSMVMEHAFGAADLPGPRWVHTPSPEIRREVSAAMDADLPRGAILYVLPEMVYSRELRTAFGDPAVPGAPGASGFLFFVDLTPGVPWGHACEYLFRANDGVLTRQRAIWPPEGLDRFVPIARG